MIKQVLIKEVYQETAIFVIIVIFQRKSLGFCQMSPIMSVNFTDFVILNIEDVDCCCIINGMSKGDAVSLLQDADFAQKKIVLQK